MDPEEHLYNNCMFKKVTGQLTQNIPKCILWYMHTILNIKLDKDLKIEAKRLADEMGIPLTTVVNSFLKPCLSLYQYNFFNNILSTKSYQYYHHPQSLCILYYKTYNKS